MSSIKIASRITLLVSFVLFYFAWDQRNIALIGFGIALTLSTISIHFSNSRSFIIPLVATTFTLSIAEVLVGFLPSNVKEQTYFDPKSNFMQGRYYDRVDNFGYRIKPGVHPISKFTREGHQIYNVSYTIGEDGYRSDIKAQYFDAYIFGCSVTFGEGLNDSETISSLVKKNHGLNIKNLGLHGYGMHQALYNLQSGVTAKNGINVILTAPWHALRSACKPSYAAGTPRYESSNGTAILNGVCDGGSAFHRALSRSNIYNLVDRALSNKENIISDKDIETYIAIINGIYSESKKNNSKLIIAYIDSTSEELQNTRWSNESIVSKLKTMSDKIVNVTLADMPEHLDPKYYLHDLDRHPSALANRERALLISNAIKELRN